MPTNKMAPPIFMKHTSFVKEQVKAAFHNSSVVVKAICVAVVVGYFVSFSNAAFDALSLTPAYLMPPHFWLWTLVTYPFMELHFWDVVIDIGVVGLCGKLLEPLWGAMEMLIFFSLINTCVALACVLTYLFAYTCTRDPAYLYDAHVHGLVGYVAAVAVAVRQFMPEHVLSTTPCGKFRNRHVPAAVLALVVVMFLLGGLRGIYPCMFAAGLAASWVYLRFYQRHGNGTRGDMADGFTFASFFPNVIQPVVAIFSNSVYSLMVKLRLCKRVVRRYDVGAPSSITISLPGTDPHDAERRRQKAIKALNERLLKHDEESWPILDEGEETTPPAPATPETTPGNTKPPAPAQQTAAAAATAEEAAKT
ncbi:PREDICTED: transmembrane protein 115-like [Priapulus caudatus]|uniref:Transmembrane protein 115-like n=1 Tax=Priapulus caudatus TaxID=37621 RepID=A0ABM1F4A5_PRICU|nr:PREDICTED: transmembrane protein 115-like [Priapulus caudatus]